MSEFQLSNAVVDEKIFLVDFSKLEDRLDAQFYWENFNFDNCIKLSKISKVSGGKRLPKGLDYSKEQTNYRYLRVGNIDWEGNLAYNDFKYLSNKFIEIMITFESKYESGAYRNNLKVPNIAYHLSIQLFKNNILENGLYPKSLNRKSKHPERIYMFYNKNKYLELLQSLKISDIFNNKDNKYMLLEIKLTDKNIIHTDPNYIDGFYTTDNISVKNIKILKENI